MKGKKVNSSRAKIITSSKKNDSSFYDCNIYSHLLHQPVLSIEEVVKLTQEMKKGNKNAKNILIEKNIGLVISIVNRFLGKGLSFDDLVQEGILGLMKAVDKFDETKGFCFSTYASWWIQQSMRRAIKKQTKTVYIPEHLFSKYNSLQKKIAQLEKKLGRKPSIEEIAKETNLTVQKINELNVSLSNVISINKKIGDSEETELEEFLSYDHLTPEEQVIENEKSVLIYQLLSDCGLSEQEKEIILWRYGFIDGELKSLSEISQYMGVTSQRISRIEIKALTKLRNSKKIEEFIIYMDCPDLCLQNLDFIRKSTRKYKSIERQKNNNQKKESELNMLVEDENKVEQSKSKRGTKNIYEVFSTYSKEEVKKALASLSEDDLALLHKRYGEDFDHPVYNKSISQSERLKISNVIFRRIEKLLPQKEAISSTSIPPKPEEIKESQIEAINSKPSIESSTESAKEDYIKILEIFNNKEFIEMTRRKPLKECLILSLKLGYIDNKYFSTNAIASFLGVDSSEIHSILKKELVDYKEKILHQIDQAIELETSEKPYVKKLKKDITE